MLQTGAWYKQQAERRMRASVDSRFDAVDVLNRAGLELLQARPWGPSLDDEWTIRAKKNQDFIPFPPEVVRINSEIRTPSTSERVQMRGKTEVRKMQQRNDMATSSSNMLWTVALHGRRGATPNDAAQRGLLIFPTPIEDDSPTLLIAGTRGWRPFTLTTLDQKPSLCEQWHNAYFLAVCCVAIETKSPEEGEAPERKRLGDAIEALWQEEQDTVTDMGELRGAVDRMDEQDPFPVDWNNSAQNP
jgi:hypothetical protein